MTDCDDDGVRHWRSVVERQIDLSPCNGCDACGLRCTAGVQMSRAEFEAVQKYRAENIEAVSSVESQDKVFDLGDGVTFEICRFRDRELGRCTIYPVRPLVCRLLGHVEWLPCPIQKIETVANTQDALQLMREYSRVERRTYEEWNETA